MLHLYLRHDFYDIIFTIKLNSSVAAGSVSRIEKFWMRICPLLWSILWSWEETLRDKFTKLYN